MNPERCNRKKFFSSPGDMALGYGPPLLLLSLLLHPSGSSNTARWFDMTIMITCSCLPIKWFNLVPLPPSSSASPWPYRQDTISSIGCLSVQVRISIRIISQFSHRCVPTYRVQHLFHNYSTFMLNWGLAWHLQVFMETRFFGIPTVTQLYSSAMTLDLIKMELIPLTLHWHKSLWRFQVESGT